MCTSLCVNATETLIITLAVDTWTVFPVTMTISESSNWIWRSLGKIVCIPNRIFVSWGCFIKRNIPLRLIYLQVSESVFAVHTVEIMMSIYALHTVQTPQDSPISLIQYLHTCCSPGSTIMELTNRRVQSVHTVLIRLCMPREILK